MSLLYGLIAREQNVLVEYSDYEGNIDTFAKRVLKKVKKDTKVLFKCEDNYFSNVLSEGDLIYLCMREADYPSENAYAFLESLRTEFLNTFTNEAINLATQDSLKDTFQFKLKEKIIFFNSANKNLNGDEVSRLKDGLFDTKNAIIEATEELSMRGEKVQLISKKAEVLRSGSKEYSSASSRVKKAAQWRNRKIIIASILLAIVILYFLITVICGGFTWDNCV